ncbi:hypothetical protein STTU_0326 [Streptomyces sp. Tu6071]|nr:hypothetical protein STTU_0326 [Streptomyces sp. Tu6071]
MRPTPIRITASAGAVTLKARVPLTSEEHAVWWTRPTPTAVETSHLVRDVHQCEQATCSGDPEPGAKARVTGSLRPAHRLEEEVHGGAAELGNEYEEVERAESWLFTCRATRVGRQQRETSVGPGRLVVHRAETALAVGRCTQRGKERIVV